MPFHDIRFPLDVSLGARGGPGRRTDIVQLASGAEYRNSPHRHSRRRYDAGVGVKSLSDMQRLIAFFEARGGELHSFRFRDPLDHTAEGEVLGVGDGATTDYPIIKTYGDAAASYQRPIRLAEAVVVEPALPHAVEDGVVKFTNPVPEGVEIVAKFTFDTPVRFATDRLDIALDDLGAGEVVSLPLIEVLASELDA